MKRKRHTNPVTHKTRAERRRQIAEAVRESGNLDAISARFDVTIETARKACRQHGVEVSTRSVPQVFRSYAIIADMINTSMKLCDIAVKYRAKLQRISVTYRKCLEVGIPVRIRKQGRPKT